MEFANELITAKGQPSNVLHNLSCFVFDPLISNIESDEAKQIKDLYSQKIMEPNIIKMLITKVPNLAYVD